MSLIAGSGVALADETVQPEETSSVVSSEDVATAESNSETADTHLSDIDDRRLWNLADVSVGRLNITLPTSTSKTEYAIRFIREDDMSVRDIFIEADTQLVLPEGRYQIYAHLSCGKRWAEANQIANSLEIMGGSEAVLSIPAKLNKKCTIVRVNLHGINPEYFRASSAVNVGYAFDYEEQIERSPSSYDLILPAGSFSLIPTRFFGRGDLWPYGKKLVLMENRGEKLLNPYCDVISDSAMGRKFSLSSGEEGIQIDVEPEKGCSTPTPGAVKIAGDLVFGRMIFPVLDDVIPEDVMVQHYWWVKKGDEYIPYMAELSSLSPTLWGAKEVRVRSEYAGREVRVVSVFQMEGKNPSYVLSPPVKFPDLPNDLPQSSDPWPGDGNHSGDSAQSVHPAVDASVESVGQGGAVEFVATGFVPGEPVTFVVHSDPVTVGTVPADASGRAVISWVVPAGFELGKHTVIATGQKSGRESRDTFHVRSASISGGSWSWLAGLGSSNAGTGTGSGSGVADTDVTAAGTSTAASAGDATKDAGSASTEAPADSDAKVSVKVVTKGMPVTGADATTVVAVAALLLAVGAGITLRRVNR